MRGTDSGSGARPAPRRPRGNSISAIAHAIAKVQPHPAYAPGAQHAPVSPQRSSVFGPLHSADAPITQALHHARATVQRAQQREPTPPPTAGQTRIEHQAARQSAVYEHANHLLPDWADPITRHELGQSALTAKQDRPFDVGKVTRAIQLGLPEAKGLADIGGTIFSRSNQGRSVLQQILGQQGDPLALDPKTGVPYTAEPKYFDGGKLPKGAAQAQESMAAAADPVKSSAQFALNQITRPLHFVEGGAHAALTGGNPLSGATQAFLHTNKAPIGSTILHDLGVHNKALASIGGFGVDVFADPATYLSGGASIPAKEAARTAAEEAARVAAQEAASLGPRAAAQAESAAYQKAYEETFAAHPGKARGVHVGGRVHVPLTNVTLEGRTPAIGSTFFAQARHRLGEAVRQGESKKTAAPRAVVRAASHVTPQMRPPGFTDAQWETLRQSARVYRGNVNARERHAMEVAQGLHKAVPAEQHPGFVAGLESPGPLTREQQALHQQFNQMGNELLARNAISGRIGDQQLPHVPEVTANVQASRQALDQAIRERARQERTHQEALAGAGVARGRAQVLSRNVGGASAERRAAALTVPAGVNQFVAGGKGVQDASRGLMASAGNLAAARQAVRDATQAHEAVMAQAAGERAAQRAGQRGQAQFYSSAQRFVPHTTQAELAPKGSRMPGKPSSSSTGGFTSGKHRRYVEPIHLQTNSAAEHFSTNPAAVSAHYFTKGGRRIEGSDYWNRVAGMGKVLTHGTEVAGLKPGEMVYKVDAHGLHPIESKLEPGTVNEAKVRRALARDGQPVDPADHFVVLPQHLVEQAQTMIQRGSGSEHAFTRGYDALLGQTKAFQTIRNPAYQLTNLSGDVFMARQAGATTRDFIDAKKVSQESHRQSAHRTSAAAARGEKLPTSEATVTIKGRKVPVAEIAKRFEKQGLQEGHVVDIQDVLGHQIGQGQRRLHLPGREPGMKSGRLRRFNTARELYPRYATFISGLKRGLSDQAAARLVVNHHFDYSELTPAERGLRRVIPFYTFARRNAGLQARMLAKPRVASHFQSAREETAAAQGKKLGDWEQTLRGYERQGLPFPLPGLNLFTRMPLTDLNQITLNPQTALRNVTTRLASPITTGLGLAMNRDFFFNQPINPNDPTTNRVQSGAKGLVPAPNIPGLTPLLEKMGVVQPIQGTRKGEGTVPGWSPYIPFILRSLPQTNYAQQIATNSPGTNHGVSTGLSVLNMLTGLKLSQAQPAQEAYTQALTFSNVLQSQLNDAELRGQAARAATLKQQMEALQKQLPTLRKAAGYKVRPRSRRRAFTGVLDGSSTAGGGVIGGG